ncbi:hypothetical protein F5Y10DRAFT_291817 [Nemania abortiva]|nr:hypothetical protein F5Y10DRAFT_291817 [Nemania abortiva]
MRHQKGSPLPVALREYSSGRRPTPPRTEDDSRSIRSEYLSSTLQATKPADSPPNHTRRGAFKGPNLSRRPVKGAATLKHLEVITISRDNTACESSRRSNSFAYLGSKLMSCHHTNLKLKSIQETLSKRTENKPPTLVAGSGTSSLRDNVKPAIAERERSDVSITRPQASQPFYIQRSKDSRDTLDLNEFFDFRRFYESSPDSPDSPGSHTASDSSDSDFSRSRSYSSSFSA